MSLINTIKTRALANFCVGAVILRRDEPESAYQGYGQSYGEFGLVWMDCMDIELRF